MFSNMSRKLKICIVQPILSPYWSNRLKILQKNNDINITLLLERAGFHHRPGWNVEPIDGVSIEIIGSTIFNITHQNKDFNYHSEGVRSIPFNLFPKLLRLRPDIVVCCNATQVLISLPLKLFFNIKIAILVEDTLHATRNVGWVNSRMKAWAYKSCDIRFPFSNDAVKYLEKVGITDHISRTSWSLDMELFKTNQESSREKGKAVKGGERTVIFVGKLVTGKGVLHLLEAWRILPEQIRTDARLLIVGSGPLKDEINMLVRSHNLYEITLLGQVDYTEVHNILRDSDLFVLPTLQDLFSLTVLEAMACGCPVITTPFNGARELIENDENGWIVDPTVPYALSTTLHKALSGDCDLIEMGKKARSRVEKMDNEIVMSQFAKDLREMITK